ncbi:MAG: sialate O-acetylesterase [Bacteroidota bacterium]
MSITRSAFLLLAFVLSAEAVDAQDRPARVGDPDPSAAVSVSPSPTLDGYDFFIVAGQSNAKGNGDAATSLQPELGEGYAITRQGDISHLEDPFGNAATGSAWPAFAKAYTARTGRGVIMISMSRSGTIQYRNPDVPDGKHWDVRYEDNLYDHSSDLAARAYITAEASLPDVRFGGWLWIQGGADAIAIFEGRQTPEQYEGALHRMAREVYADWGAPLMHVVSGGWTGGDPPAAQDVRRVQNEGDALDEILVIYRDAVTFVELGWHVDEVHWDQRGLNEVGRQGGDFVGDWRVGDTTPPPPGPAPTPEPEPVPQEGVVIAPNPSTGGQTPTIIAPCKVRFAVFDSIGRRLLKGRSDRDGNIELPDRAPSGQYSIRVTPTKDEPGCVQETATFTILN